MLFNLPRNTTRHRGPRESSSVDRSPSKGPSPRSTTGSGSAACCAASAPPTRLANPKRTLRVLPGALYELGVAVVISLTVAPQLVESVQRVRRARKLRGGTRRGMHGSAHDRHPGDGGRSRAIPAPCGGDGLERLRPHRKLLEADTAGDRASCWSPACADCASAPMDSSTARFPDRSDSRALPSGSRLCWLGLSLGSRRVGRRPVPTRPVEAAGVDRRGFRHRACCGAPGQESARPRHSQSVDRSAGLASMPLVPTLAMAGGGHRRSGRSTPGAPSPPMTAIPRESCRQGRRISGDTRVPTPRCREPDTESTCRHDRVRPGVGHLRRRRQPRDRGREPPDRRGGARARRRTNRCRQVHPARSDQRAGPTLHRGDPGRNGDRRRSGHPNPSPT